MLFNETDYDSGISPLAKVAWCIVAFQLLLLLVAATAPPPNSVQPTMRVYHVPLSCYEDTTSTLVCDKPRSMVAP